MTSKSVQRPGAEDLRPEAFFDLRDVQHARLFQGTKYAWEALARLPQYVVETFDELKSSLLSEGRLQTSGPRSVKVSGGNGLVIKPPGLELPTDLWVDGELIIEEGVNIGPFCRISGRNYLATEAVLESHVVLDGNHLLGSGCHLGPFSYLRGSVILGARSHVRAEIKDSVLLDAISVPDPDGGEAGAKKIGTSIAHGLYVGDAVVGRGVNLGAGTMFATTRLDWKEVYPLGQQSVVQDASGVKLDLPPVGFKFSAIVGDWANVACGSILGPGAVIGRRSRLYPQSVVTGYIPPDHTSIRRGLLRAIRGNRGVGTYSGRI